MDTVRGLGKEEEWRMDTVRMNNKDYCQNGEKEEAMWVFASGGGPQHTDALLAPWIGNNNNNDISCTIIKQ